MSWENLFMPYANNKGADQPVHPRSLISAFVVRCLDSIIPLVSIPEISSLCLASVAVQTGMSLPWSQTLKTGFLISKVSQSVSDVRSDICITVTILQNHRDVCGKYENMVVQRKTCCVKQKYQAYGRWQNDVIQPDAVISIFLIG